jgi:hypothetical protein
MSMTELSVGDLADLPEPSLAPVAQQQEAVRRILALALVALFMAVVVAVLWSVLTGRAVWDDVSDPVTYVLGVVTGLVGPVLGFYYGQRES